MGVGGPDQIAAGGVQHALGLSGRSGGVENEQRIFRAHGLAGAVRRHLFALNLIGEVTTLLHQHTRAGAPDHQHVGHIRALQQGQIDVLLQRHDTAAAQTLVGGDDEGRLAVLNPAGDRVGGEAAENHAVHGPDAGAGQHGVGRLGDHWHVDGDPVALLHAARLEHIGHAAHLGMHLAVGDRAAFGRIVALPDDRHVIGAPGQVPVEAVVGRVEDPVLVPADVEIGLIVRHVLGDAERLDPVQALGDVAPVTLGVFLDTRDGRVIGGGVHVGPRGPGLGNRKHLTLAHDHLSLLATLQAVIRSGGAEARNRCARRRFNPARRPVSVRPPVLEANPP